MWIEERLLKSNLCFLIQITIMTVCNTSYHNLTTTTTTVTRNNASLVTMNEQTTCTKNTEKEKNSTAEDNTFVYSYLTSGAHNFNDSVTIGFLGAYGQAQVVLGALPLAVEAVNNAKDLLPGRRLTYIAADIGTNPGASGLARRKSSLAARAIRIMTAMRDNGTIAFIGPDDTCSSEALVSAAWNLPMISYVQTVLGFRIEFVELEDTAWGKKLGNGSYDGAYRKLETNAADLGIGLFYANVSEYWDFDLSFPYMEEASKWVVPTAKPRKPWERIFKTFDLYIWMLILISIFFNSLLLRFFAKKFSDLQTYQNFYYSLLVSFQHLFSQSANLLPKKLPVKLILLMWMIVSWLIGIAFQSKLTSALNFIFYEHQIRTVEEVIESGMDFGFFKQANILFSNKDSPIETYIYNNFEPCSLDMECLNRTAYDADYATINLERSMKYFIGEMYLDSDGRSLIYIFEDRVYTVLINLVYVKGFPMREKIDEMLLLAKASGFVNYYYKRAEERAIKMNMKVKRMVLGADVLSLDEVYGVFALLVMGWVVSVAVFVLEVFMRPRMTRRKNLDQKRRKF